MILEKFRSVLEAKLGISASNDHFEPDNRETRRRKERVYRRFMPIQPKVYDYNEKYPLKGYKSPHKPREIASRKLVKR